MYYVFVLLYDVTRIGTIKLGIHKASNEPERKKREKEVEAHKKNSFSEQYSLSPTPRLTLLNLLFHIKNSFQLHTRLLTYIHSKHERR